MGLINEPTAYEAWKKALSTVLHEGKYVLDRRNRRFIEILNLFTNIENSKEKISEPIDRLNKFKIWEYPPIQEMENAIFSRKLDIEYNYGYGPRVFNYQNKIDQINDFVIPLLKSGSTSRRAVICFWEVTRDLILLNEPSPARMLIDFKLRNNKLNATSIIRSNDIFFGWPADIFQVNLLQKYIQKKLRCELGKLSTFSTSAHIYKDQIPYIKEVLEE